jgi:hypothetical protein
LLRGPEKGLTLAEVPVSPDLRFVALYQWKDDPDGKGQTRFHYLLDRQTGELKVVESSGLDLSLVGWRGTGQELRATAVTNRWNLPLGRPSELYLVDPGTGKPQLQPDANARLDVDSPLAPDGKHRIRVGKEDFVVADTAGGGERRFTFHEDDRRYVGRGCLEWVTPRYLKFNGPRLALIDVSTMKMCYPDSSAGPKQGWPTYRFSADLRWMLFDGEGVPGEGLYLAPVDLPE